MTSPRILAFAGSIRTGSINAKLTALVVKELALADVPVTQISLADYPLPIYDGDLEAQSGVPENAKRLHGLMVEHQGIFIASPEYNAGVTPLLKNAIDWVSRIRTQPTPWKGRAYAIGAASGGNFGGYRGLIQLRQTLGLGLGATVIPEMTVVMRAGDAFNEAGGFREEAMSTTLRTMVTRLVEEAARHLR
ncbi:NADPH-dependent FMN reductase [Prosthecomicrobium sp. N25]|uniref:NADPH-dependent FMN reductase n=1 Tax=Prosthecomicrobium sp. N25 TaxID=3129254 RepID=UPI0030788ECC